jgi:Na+/H+ antiporter NhaD/arsenite permease-like protein
MAIGRVSTDEAMRAVDLPTIALLFGLMVVSAQLRLGGFYAAVTRRIAAAQLAPPLLLGALIGTAGALSAVLANDIVCLAMAPVLARGCLRRGLDPVPFLLALAAAANVGSAATLIGNPQNMLIGQTLRLSFVGYLGSAAVPAALGLLAVWGLIARHARGRWQMVRAAGDVGVTTTAAVGAAVGAAAEAADEAAAEVAGDTAALDADEPRRLDRWQTVKGLLVTVALMIAFLVAPWPREALALGAAGILLLSRKMASRHMLALVDWHLLVLFVGLFVVNHALAETGMLAAAMRDAARAGVDAAEPAHLYWMTAVLSNLVSNVPAVMLLLPAATHPQAGAILALASTLAGNLIVVGSIANIIVVDQAAALGIRIGWREHARLGVPITLVTLGIAVAWLALR